MNMKIGKYVCIAIAMGMCISCVRSTEKYAQKEHGKKFDLWEILYRADDYDVYQPKLKLVDPVGGTLVETKNKKQGSDTIRTGAKLHATIYTYKSKNDAKYYNDIYFRVCDSDGNYYTRLEHNFVFNEGQKDSVSFSTKSDSDHCFSTNKEKAKQIIALFCGRDPFSIKVSYKGKTFDGKYSFIVEGSPKLDKGIKTLKSRKSLADKEVSKKETLLYELFK